jgi:hypothetical protein
VRSRDLELNYAQTPLMDAAWNLNLNEIKEIIKNSQKTFKEKEYKKYLEHSDNNKNAVQFALWSDPNLEVFKNDEEKTKYINNKIKIINTLIKVGVPIVNREQASFQLQELSRLLLQNESLIDSKDFEYLLNKIIDYINKEKSGKLSIDSSTAAQLLIKLPLNKFNQSELIKFQKIIKTNGRQCFEVNEFRLMRGKLQERWKIVSEANKNGTFERANSSNVYDSMSSLISSCKETEQVDKVTGKH